MRLAQKLRSKVDSLQNKVKHLVAEGSELKQRIADLLKNLAERDRKIADLESDIKRLLKQQYGPKSERPDDTTQLLITEILEQLEEGQTNNTSSDQDQPGEEEAPPRKRKRPPGAPRQSLQQQMAHLPERIETLDLPETEKIDPDTGQPLPLIGYEETRRIAEQPASLYQLVIRRPKYSNPGGLERGEPGVKMVPAPDNTPIEKCRADVSVLASIITDKYLDHLTLYRIQERYWRLGKVWIDRKTLCGWVGGCADALEPIYKEMAKRIFESGYVGFDDTILRMLQPAAKAGRTKNVRLWAYVGLLDKAPYTLYDFTLTREKTGPLAFIPQDYQGWLQGDAYSGHDEVMKRPDIEEAGCWDHGRRHFVESTESAPETASAALARIKRLYRIERKLDKANAPPDEIKRIRQKESVPILTEFKEWLDKQQAQELPASPISKAINYALNQWEALSAYVQDGNVPISNCASENAMRPVAIGRKNWLFVGNETSGHQTAILLSITQTCRRLGIDVRAYLTDVLARVNTHTADRIAELLPDQWAAEKIAAGADIRLRGGDPRTRRPAA